MGNEMLSYLEACCYSLRNHFFRCHIAVCLAVRNVMHKLSF